MKILDRIAGAVDFAGYYLTRLVVANLQIAWEIITPGLRTSPGFVELPVDIRSRTGLLLFSNFLSMTPGTLTVSVDADRTTILVHVLYSGDRGKVIREVETIQKKIKRITG